MTSTYPCPRCGRRHPEDQLDDTTGLCANCRDTRTPTKRYADAHPDRRSCVVCGKAIAGYSNKKTCSTRGGVALHRRRDR
jgi:hypothetical protein